MTKDWDNLIILDGCRYDIFAKLNTIDGDLTSIYSCGSNTTEFLVRNFNNKTFPNTVYVSANPHTDHPDRPNINVSVHQKINVWEDGWDSELQTVPLENVASVAKESSEQFPNKRLIVHFMQPHYPFIGPTGKEIEQRGVVMTGDISQAQNNYTVWDILKRGEIDDEDIIDAYKENLEIVLPHVEAVVETLSGKTVITSDHGNELGFLGMYGHRGKKVTGGAAVTSGLRRVPWLVINEARKSVTTDGVQESDAQYEDSVDEKLSALGYRE